MEEFVDIIETSPIAVVHKYHDSGHNTLISNEFLSEKTYIQLKAPAPFDINMQKDYYLLQPINSSNDRDHDISSNNII